MNDSLNDIELLLQSIFKEVRKSAIAAEEVTEVALQERIERILEGKLFDMDIK